MESVLTLSLMHERLTWTDDSERFIPRGSPIVMGESRVIACDDNEGGFDDSKPMARWGRVLGFTLPQNMTLGGDIHHVTCRQIEQRHGLHEPYARTGARWPFL